MIDNQLSSNATEQEIVSVVDKICGMLPSTLGQLVRLFPFVFLALFLTFLFRSASPL